MSAQADFKQISSSQWSGLSLGLRNLLRVFSPSAAERIDIKLAQAMDANSVFKDYLSKQLQPDPTKPVIDDSIFISAKNQTVANWPTEAVPRPTIEIAASDFDNMSASPASMVLRMAHELGHATRPGGMVGWSQPQKDSGVFGVRFQLLREDDRHPRHRDQPDRRRHLRHHRCYLQGRWVVQRFGYEGDPVGGGGESVGFTVPSVTTELIASYDHGMRTRA